MATEETRFSLVQDLSPGAVFTETNLKWTVSPFGSVLAKCRWNVNAPGAVISIGSPLIARSSAEEPV